MCLSIICFLRFICWKETLATQLEYIYIYIEINNNNKLFAGYSEGFSEGFLSKWECYSHANAESKCGGLRFVNNIEIVLGQMRILFQC